MNAREASYKYTSARIRTWLVRQCFRAEQLHKYAVERSKHHQLGGDRLLTKLLCKFLRTHTHRERERERERREERDRIDTQRGERQRERRETHREERRETEREGRDRDRREGSETEAGIERERQRETKKKQRINGNIHR